MSEAKHTPGPWWVTDIGVRDRGGYIFHTNPVTHYPGQDDRYAKEVAEREANKALAAALPELLKALQLAVRQGEHDMLLTGDELRVCRSALAKATTPQSTTTVGRG